MSKDDRNHITHYGSIDVKKSKRLLNKRGMSWDQLVTRGSRIPAFPGRPKVALLNANPFSEGIANLGFQTIMQWLISHEINVYVGFADTCSTARHFLNDPNTKAGDCDVIAISIPFEDTYLNVVRLIRSIGLNTLAASRNGGDPLVVAGGMAMINPMPFQDFIDAFVIGEGRPALVEIAERCASSLNKSEVLESLAGIAGVYVPSSYSIVVDDRGRVSEFDAGSAPKTVYSTPALNMAANPIYSNWTSEFACYEYDDYFSVMMALGCKKKCPFCVVGHVQGLRTGEALNVDDDVVVNLAEERRDRYGTDLVKLFFSSAFSSGDGDIDSEDLKTVHEKLIGKGFQVRDGSLNVKQADRELMGLLKAAGQTELTFAPETVERLRPGMLKSYITDEKLHQLAEWASEGKLDYVLYTLCGVPGETDDTPRELGRLVRSIRNVLAPDCRMEVHYNPVFTKAQTPFQYYRMLRPKEIRRKFNLLKSSAGQGITFVSVIDDPMCYYQPILARGDPRLGNILLELSRYSQPTEAQWKEALARHRIDDSSFFDSRDPNDRLPWEHIDYANHQKLKSRFSFNYAL